MMRRCNSAVLCSRSIHSVAKLTAVLKPNVSVVDSKIVVNGLGHSHNAETFFVQLIGDGEAVVSTDGNKSVDLVIAEPLKHLIGTVNLRFASVGMLDHATERIAAIGGTKNGAAEVRNLADGRTMKFHQSTVGETFRLEESVVALANADDLPAPNLLAAYTAP